MFKNGIAGASGSFAIGLASSEFAKSLTMKAIIPAIQRILARMDLHTHLGGITPFDFQDVTSMAVYWIIMVFVAYVISEYIFGRFLLGTATVLDTEEKKTLHRAEAAVQQEGGAFKSAHNVMAAAVGVPTLRPPDQGFPQSVTFCFLLTLLGVVSRGYQFSPLYSFASTGCVSETSTAASMNSGRAYWLLSCDVSK
jgi:hypothetical protein